MSGPLRRGDTVLLVAPGDFGKPRPALVIQADAFLDPPASVTMALITTTAAPGAPRLRVRLDASPENGLRETSFVMCDKIVSHLPDRIRKRIGRVDQLTLAAVEDGLRLWLGLI